MSIAGIFSLLTACMKEGASEAVKPSAVSIFAPQDAKEVTMRIYDKAEGGEPIKTIQIKKDTADTGEGVSRWEAFLPKKYKGKYYTFEVTAADGTKLGETPPPGAVAVGTNGKRGAIISLDDTNPEGWKQDKRPALESPADLVIYEMHHRDCSMHPSSGIENKGKFLALTEEKAIKHLQELGINAVHILPSFDFASIDEASDKPQYNWGYDPLNYNVPEGSYSTDANNPRARIKEFKQMVMALHKAGIRVILDVVYNHTFDIAGSAFQRTLPDYYYRKDDKGEYSNGSGCGNETASEKPLMQDFIISSVCYWANEYHIDGFRFDLMGVHDIATMNKVRKALHDIDPTIFIYGEGWSAGACAIPEDERALKANMQQMAQETEEYGSPIAAFSDDMRDALRGPFNDDTKGAFLAGKPGEEESLKFGIAGAISHPQVEMSKVNYSKQPWAKEPTQQISYVSCHDDMCLTDRLRTSIPGISQEELIRLDLLAQTAVFTSQGIPFMLAGEEALRDKKGVHNSYNSPDSINSIDWSRLKEFPQVFDYYKGLIAMRKQHKAFRLATADKVREHLEFLPAKDCLVAFRLKDLKGIDEWDDIIVVLNANKKAATIDIPEGEYTVVCKEGVVNTKGIGKIQGGKAEAAPQSALIIHR